MSLAPLDLVSADAWHRMTFTTYALSVSFFEAISLGRLIRGGGRQALILADVESVSARVYRRYAAASNSATVAMAALVSCL